MNTEVIGRMMEAKKYQMMAVKALFPEGKQEHIDNIERELKALFSESMMDVMMNVMNTAGDIRSQMNQNQAEAGCNCQSTDEKSSDQKNTDSKTTYGSKSRSRTAGVKKEKVHKVTIE